MTADDLSRFCCLNPDGSDHGKRGHGNRPGTARDGHARSSECKGTPLFDTRLAPAAARLERVAGGVGTRKAARSVGVHRDTVTRYVRAAGDHARQRHDERAAFSPDDG